MRSKGNGSFLVTSVFLMAIILLLTCFSPFAFGQQNNKNLPARGISLAPEFTSLILPKDEKAVMELVVMNMGRRGENINLTVTSIPEGWKAWIKTFSFAVTGIHLKSDSSKILKFRAEPGPDMKPGKYRFNIEAKTEDGKIRSSNHVTITVKGEKEVRKETEGVHIITSYPVLRGPTGSKFEFSLQVESRLDEDAMFNLSFQGPDDWDIKFKPSNYETQFISSLLLNAQSSKALSVLVKPHPWAKPGEYPITIKVSSPSSQDEATLTVALTGTYDLNVSMANELLSLSALQGKESNLSLYVKNNGSAIINNVQCVSLKPENWKVEFRPENIEVLAPDEMKQIEVSITPSEQALVGDYSVGLNVGAEAGSIKKNIELRVTVKASSAWAWTGIGIIILVMAGLAFLFIRLGRR